MIFCFWLKVSSRMLLRCEPLGYWSPRPHIVNLDFVCKLHFIPKTHFFKKKDKIINLIFFCNFTKHGNQNNFFRENNCDFILFFPPKIIQPQCTHFFVSYIQVCTCPAEQWVESSPVEPVLLWERQLLEPDDGSPWEQHHNKSGRESGPAWLVPLRASRLPSKFISKVEGDIIPPRNSLLRIPCWTTAASYWPAHQQLKFIVLRLDWLLRFNSIFASIIDHK